MTTPKPISSSRHFLVKAHLPSGNIFIAPAMADDHEHAHELMLEKLRDRGVSEHMITTTELK